MGVNWLQVAAKTARHSDLDFSLGAVIIKGSSVLSTGFNKRRNEVEVVGKLEDCHTHAEVDAIAGASPDQLHGAVLFVARVARDGTLRNAQPCWRCMNAIQAAGIKRLVWSNGPGEKGRGTSLKLNRVNVPAFTEVFTQAELDNRFAASTVREIVYAWYDLHVPKNMVSFI